MRVVGMMSGTSIDGIDVAIADILELPPITNLGATPPKELSEPRLSIQQLAFQTVAWNEATRRTLFALFQEKTSAAAICEANFTVATVFANALLAVLQQEKIPLHSLDLIASHGQTIWHNVVDGKVTSTLQIGDPSVIAARTGITTVANFRTADVAAGGQGAPLVSLYDWYFLRPPATAENAAGQWRAVQNIGGIGNVTFLPPVGDDGPPIAFDTGPGNLFIDWAASMATDGAEPFDRDGHLAQRGQVAEALLTQWLALPYFRQAPPKSTGRELFDNKLVAEWWAVAQNSGLSPADFVATVTELTAASIADAYANFSPGPLAEIIVAGGGARNPVLLKAIQRQLAHKLNRALPLRTHQEIGIDDKAKEALAFALMGYLTIHGKAGNVPACTGAHKEQILGQIAPGQNYFRLLSETFARQ